MPKRKPVLWLLFFSICLTLAVPAVISGFGSFGQLLRLSWPSAFGLLGTILVSWGFNAFRVRHLLATLDKEVGFRQALVIAVSAEFAGHATPASSGMPVAFAFLLKDLGLTAGRAVGLSGIMMALDFVFFIAVMMPSAIVMLAQHPMRKAGFLLGLAATVAAGGLVFLWLVVRHYRRLFHFISRQMVRFRWTARRRYRFARSVVEMVRALRRLRRMPKWGQAKLVAYTVGYWMPRYLVLLIAVWLVAPQVPVSYIFLIQSLFNIGIEALLLPGGGGGVDALFFGLLSPYLSPADTTFALIVWRAYTFYWYLLIGGPIFFLRTRKDALALLRG